MEWISLKTKKNKETEAMETNSINDAVNHPRHYTEGFAPVTIECIDITRHMPFTVGNAFKYVWRAGKKGGPEKTLEDLRKALWYIQDAVQNDCIADYPAAFAVFSLIPKEDTFRWRALHHLANRLPCAAERTIEEWIEEVEND